MMILLVSFTACSTIDSFRMDVYQTSAQGDKCLLIDQEVKINTNSVIKIKVSPDEKFQEIVGIGGSFTEASAYLLNQISPKNRKRILEAYFGVTGARYSLTRTHMNSCDFSLNHYTYAPVPEDLTLKHFSIQEDKDDLVPMIKDAMAISTDGFKIISSPWTAPPWMKDNQDWRGGKLLPEYYPIWAQFFSKYLDAYAEEGIHVWGITVENEPLGNDNNWESMHFTPEEMNTFVKNHLGPVIREKHPNVKIFGFDQNRDDELIKWADSMYNDQEAARYYDGMAVHWYASTFDIFPNALQYAIDQSPGKLLINTEACIDAQIPVWKDDKWYWSAEATDWGYYWAPENQKYLHPKYVPVYRYARDIIGCLNNGVHGWIDWNMVLNRQGGPNWFGNWCTAPIIVDEESDEIYFTPLYHIMMHFSRFIRPGASRIGLELLGDGLMATAVCNPDGNITIIVLNEHNHAQPFDIELGAFYKSVQISPRALQTLVFSKTEKNIT